MLASAGLSGGQGVAAGAIEAFPVLDPYRQRRLSLL
jgi:hypothetical protein